MSFPNTKYASAASLLHTLNTAERESRSLGQKLDYDDGRKFRFCLAGGTSLVVGTLQEGKPVVTADYTNVIVDVLAVVGATQVSVTPTVSTAKDYYADGWMHVNKHAAGEGAYVYRVKSHVLFASASGKIVTLYPDDTIRAALAVNDEVGFDPNPYNGIVIATQDTLVQRVVGVACTPVTNAQYGWVQTGGMCAIAATNSNLIVGNYASAVLTAAGRVAAQDGNIDERVGIALSVPDDAGEFAAVWLIIDR